MSNANYAVIDTNVLVSALISKHSDSATVAVVEKIISGELIPVYSVDIIKEYNEVLHRDKFKFPSTQIEYILYAIVKFGVGVEAEPTGVELIDIKDLPFYEVVVEKRKTDEAYLVTGNIKHFPVEPFIVTPKEMLKIIEDKLV